MNTAFQKTERIKSIFLDTQLFYATHNNIDELTVYLENVDKEFKSIGYESASMAIAIKSFESDNFPETWLSFVNGAALLHQAQVYVGLGWAIAKLRVDFLSALEKIKKDFYFRIADGCGYYDGSFRYRRSVLQAEIPSYLPEVALPMYDQGIGRSIWYSEKAEAGCIANRIATFEVGRQANLWRGLAIAVAYVGGCTDDELKNLFQAAGEHRTQLACGAALAARSRIMANTMTDDTEHCSRLWLSLDADATNTVFINDDYFKSIAQIEERLVKQFKQVFER